MASDPQQQAQMKRQRITMILMMIPWLIMMWYLSKQNRAAMEAQERQRVEQGAVVTLEEPPVDAPVDERIAWHQERVNRDPKSEQAETHLLSIAVIREEAGFDKKAADEYESFAKSHRKSPYYAHAAFHAGRIAREKLQDDKRFKKNLNPLTYEFKRCVWDPENVGDPNDKHIAADISAEALDAVSRDDPRYRFLDFIVGLFNPKQHPETAYAFGVMLLGLLVKILLWPLNTVNYRSSKIMGVKMRLVQPEIEELKKKYKDDHLKVMQKQQELMRKYGVSMKSGCVVSIIQMAILIPVYQTVRLYSHPLASGSFLWIESLHEPDLYLLIVYVLAFIASMKLQPQQPSADPQQQQMQKTMIYIMPIMFFFMMRTVPSAFILYWTIFLVFSTGQTLWLAYRWRVEGGDDAVIESLPEELRPNKRALRRELEAAVSPADAGRKAKRGEAPSADAKPVVERLGETIDLDDGDGKPSGGLLARLFAPALERRDAEAAPSDGENGLDGAAVTEEPEVAGESEDVGPSEPGLTADERRARRKAKRRAQRKASTGA